MTSTTRTTRSKTSSLRKTRTSTPSGPKKRKKTTVIVASTSGRSGSVRQEVERDSDAYHDSDAMAQAEEGDEGTDTLDSDALDDDFDASPSKKRRRVGPTQKSSPAKKTAASVKKRSKADRDSEEPEFDSGLEVVGTVVQASKSGTVSPGEISRNTLDFLAQLKKPECNDRVWFRLHEPVFRQAEKEWKDFITEFTPILVGVDPQIPILPPNDVIHRIYRDVDRFDSATTKPHTKPDFQPAFQEAAGKGYLQDINFTNSALKPGGSMLAAGTWCPGRNEVQTIRAHITRNPRRMREIISAREFVQLFGEAKPHAKGERRNIFGMDDELKVAPKGVDKNHRDIDLLKCRSFAVVHKFTDEQVLAQDFKDRLRQVLTVVRPFVHGLNDMMTVQPAEESGEEQSDGGTEE